MTEASGRMGGPLLGDSVLLGSYDVDPVMEDEHNRWCIQEHIPERLAIPGFLRCRRYATTSLERSSARRYVNLYETDGLSVMTSAEYLTRLEAPTPWTTRMAPSVLNATRTAAAVLVSRGRGAGGYLMLADVVPPSGREWLSDFSDIAERTCTTNWEVVAVHMLRGDGDVTARKSATEEGSFFTEVRSEWILAIEGAAELEAATESFMADVADLGLTVSGAAAHRAYHCLFEARPSDPA
jgi:hypothetical protein